MSTSNRNILPETEKPNTFFYFDRSSSVPIFFSSFQASSIQFNQTNPLFRVVTMKFLVISPTIGLMFLTWIVNVMASSANLVKYASPSVVGTDTPFPVDRFSTYISTSSFQLPTVLMPSKPYCSSPRSCTRSRLLVPRPRTSSSTSFAQASTSTSRGCSRRATTRP